MAEQGKDGKLNSTQEDFLCPEMKMIVMIKALNVKTKIDFFLTSNTDISVGEVIIDRITVK